ncbi:hypothetical protein OPV22_003781 [Ensete ventricosum]|uniref:DUF4005 domain-containing protein n=1 Tax=Ensete ventricosum TaxID=4639 RepID=A0AAV8S1J1_ENSVE|nr:hypothetical protein OPV22_003781 [Ensete ventricosum]
MGVDDSCGGWVPPTPFPSTNPHWTSETLHAGHQPVHHRPSLVGYCFTPTAHVHDETGSGPHAATERKSRAPPHRGLARTQHDTEVRARVRAHLFGEEEIRPMVIGRSASLSMAAKTRSGTPRGTSVSEKYSATEERERGRGGGTTENTTAQAQGLTQSKNNLLSCTSLVHNHTVRRISAKNSHRATHILSIKAYPLNSATALAALGHSQTLFLQSMNERCRL